MHKMQPPTATQITDCDVTRAQVDVDVDDDAGCSPVAAISWKTNAQPNGLKQKQRIYTSTPKDKLKQQQPQRNDAIGFCNLAKAIRKHYIYVGEGSAAAVVKGKGEQGQGPSFFDERVIAFLILFGILIIVYRIVSLTMSLINSNMVQELSSYVQAQLSAALDWTEEHQLSSKLSPLLCGFLVASFFYGMVYMDSLDPGVNPPTPFTTRSKQRNRNTLQLSYLGAIGTGIMVTLIMYLDL
ncbi:uncharacterized protein LOC117783427 [Drosophila innubila]|uniref:uncharacterized protein LOC117783427 n=1 Tax=Drosophila innubila TaxID=198719 RepID=UPI00148CF43A|nr:uncharacterized protein LOC117783427 [Drosophila innubila]